MWRLLLICLFCSQGSPSAFQKIPKTWEKVEVALCYSKQSVLMMRRAMAEAGQIVAEATRHIVRP